MKRITVEQKRLIPAVITPPLAGCDTKVACCFALGREGVVAQQMGGATGPWALVGTRPGGTPRILGWV